MSENEMIPASADEVKNMLALSQGKFATTTALTEVTKVGDYLPYIQLMGSNSKEVKRGEFPMGHFCLRENKQLGDLTDEFIAFLISWRPKAMQYQPKVLSFFDVNTAEFQDVQKRANSKDAGCGFGPEFLLWLPEYKKMATYFLGNKTGRNEAPNLIGLIEKDDRVCKQKSELIETNDYSWHGMRTLPCDLQIEMPPAALLQAELEKFNNPPAAQEEVAGETGEEARR